MRVGLVRQSYSPSGGAEKYLLRLAAVLQSSGHVPILISGPDWPDDRWEHPDRFICETTKKQDLAPQIQTAKKELQCDVIFSLERVSTVDVFRAGDGVHQAWLDRLNQYDHPFSNFIRSKRAFHQHVLAREKAMLQRDITIIANSRMVAQELKTHYQLPDHKIHVIHNGYDPIAFNQEDRAHYRSKIRRQHNIPQDSPIIIFVGSGWKRKGVKTLIKSYSHPKLRQSHLIIIGKGAWNKHAPPNVHFTGSIQDVVPYYLAADTFVLPTLYDPFSNACLEAAAYGLPVVTTRDNGFSEILELFPNAGAICPDPVDHNALSQALIQQIERPHNRAPLDLAKSLPMNTNLQKTLHAIRGHLSSSDNSSLQHSI